MPGPGDLPARQPAPIIGRDVALARLRALVDPAPASGRVLVVTGAAGMGKTVLLAEAAGRARSAGLRVLRVTGRESEARLAFAGLHQLLRPVLAGRRGPAGPAGPGPVRGAGPCRGSWCCGPAADRGGRADLAVGSVRAVPGGGGRR